jgi:hypothetical protein
MLRPLLLALMLGAPLSQALAQDPAATVPAGGSVAVELNALRQAGDVCQAYFVVHNNAGADISALDLDAFMFDSDGVIADRLTLPFPPVAAGRMKVMAFNLNLACPAVSRVFVNEVLACETPAGPCADKLSLSSRADVELAN